ncbi:unnamed protein product [Absidia cylindrospora]
MLSSFKSSCAAIFGKQPTLATSTTNNNNNKNNSKNNSSNSKNNSSNSKNNNSNNNKNKKNSNEIDHGYEMVYPEPWSYKFIDQWDLGDLNSVGGDWLRVGPLHRR